ncbi:MAG: SPFH domain-containing protein [Clostridia bacterium]|nr:SPFH domain-containing protein [Clostridia bacterium]
MGLIKAGIGALGGVLADQWKEFFTCDSISEEVLIVKGQKNVSGRSSNTKGHDNVISNGSGIVVADGQCMIIVEQGKVVEFCAEPGQFTYDTSSEPSIFTGKLGDAIKESFKAVGKRFTFGGDAAKDQRVYYFNTKEITGNMFGTKSPIPFRVIIDERRGIDYDITLRCNGMFTFKIVDPLLLYTAVAGNIADEYRKESLMEHLKSDFLNALQPAFARLSEMGLRYSSIPAHTMELCDEMNRILTSKWQQGRGLTLVDVTFNALNAPKEDEDEIQRIKKSIIMSDPMLAGGYQTTGMTDAAMSAANNPNGAVNAFMGMGMAGNMMGNTAQLFQQGMQQQQYQAQQQPTAPAADGWKCSCGATATGNFCPNCGNKKPAPQGSWKCACGADVNGNFCPNCGNKKPEQAQGWTCACGSVNQGRFCMNCGSKKPEGAPLYKCDKCGWQPEDPHNPPKFCMNCGDIFDESDKS